MVAAAFPSRDPTRIPLPQRRKLVLEVSTFTPQLVESCKRCSNPLHSGELSCSKCHALVHADEMERKAAEARDLERRGELQSAHASWMSILPLLPHESKQAEWIREHLRELEAAAAVAYRPSQQSSNSKRARWLSPLAVLAVILAKVKTFLFLVFKLKFLLSFAAFLGVYWSMWGPKFGIGFAVLILLHEMGHFVEIKRRGLPADMPVFLPGLGAYVRWQAMGVSQEVRSLIALAGPFAGFLAAVVCALIWKQTGDGLWLALARTSAWFNVLNLIPFFMLDGGHAAEALNRIQKVALMALSVGLWYATKELLFVGVAVLAAWEVLKTSMRKAPSPAPAWMKMNTSTSPSNGQVSAMSASATENESEGSLLIAVYFIALLTALGALLFLLPGHGSGLP